MLVKPMYRLFTPGLHACELQVASAPVALRSQPYWERTAEVLEVEQEEGLVVDIVPFDNTTTLRQDPRTRTTAAGYSRSTSTEAGREGGDEFVAHVEKDEVTFFPAQEGEGENATALAKRLDQWVYEHRLPVFNFIGSHNFRELGHNSGRWMVIAVVNPSEELRKGDMPVSADPFLNGLRNVAKDFKRAKREKYIFGYLDGTKWEKFIGQVRVKSNRNSIRFDPIRFDSIR